MKIFTYDIRFDTFFRKGLPKIDDRFGVYYITGKQGSFKTYYSVYLANRQSPKIVTKIKTNIHSLKIPGFKIEYFNKLSDIYFDTEEYVIYIIDELSRKYHKNSPTDKDFYAWLNQCRKRHRICIGITQEWREMPMWLRRPCKFMISSHPTFLLGRLGLVTSVVGDGENLVFDKDENEYLCPTILKVIHKKNLRIANMYDTFEPINEL